MPNVDAGTALSDTPALSERRFASAFGYSAVAAIAPNTKNKVAPAIPDAIPRPLGSGEKTNLDGMPFSPCPRHQVPTTVSAQSALTDVNCGDGS